MKNPQTPPKNSPQGSSRQLTPQQQSALATDKNVSVTAGAGSGKTTILVERYLKIILEQRIDVRRVLAITFTEKAAAEMTERVSAMLRERLARETNPARRARLLELRERLNSAQISTIHAFCARILREFPVASGIDPDFSVLGEFQQELFASEAVDEIFGELDQQTLETPYSREEWKELLRQVPPALLKQALALALPHPYEMKLLRQRFAEQSDEQLLAKLQETFFQRLENALDTRSLPAAVLPLLAQIDAAAVSRANLTERGQQAFALIDDLLSLKTPETDPINFWQTCLDLSRLMVTSEGQPFKIPSGIGKKEDLGEAYGLVKQLSEAIHPLARFAAEGFSAVPGRVDRLGLQALRKILFLYEQVEARYREKKEERGMLDFEDLQWLALEMLQEHPAVRNTLRNRYRYIMVDEFQDTNDLQWDIISLLGEFEGELQPDKFFVVGDPKQSIYGFRNADVRVFQRVKEVFAEKHPDPAAYPGNVVLEESFRFLPALNDFVNFLFGKILQKEPENPFAVGYERLSTRREVAEPGRIELALLHKDEIKNRPALSQEDYIARTIRDLLDSDGAEEGAKVYRRRQGREEPHPLRPGDIAVLIPRRTHLLELESKLREYNIPFKTVGGVGFYRRQEIFDVYHLLRLLDNPDDDLAFAAILRSPFAGISDPGLFHLALLKKPYQSYRQTLAKIEDFSPFPAPDRRQLPLFREQLSRWEQRRDRLSLSRLLGEIFDESFYRATLAAEWNGEQLLANLDKIVEMAREYEQSGFMSLGDFIDSLHQTITLDPREGEAQIALEDEGTVKIMTVHQAKGLEFPVVFCPYLQQTPRGESGKARFDSDAGLALKIRDPQNHYREAAPFLYEWIDDRQRQKQLAELRRLFYVSVTRARDRVYLVGSYAGSELERENCLAWAVRALGIDPAALTEDFIEIAGGLKIHLTLKFDALEDAAGEDARRGRPGGVFGEAGLQALEQTLTESLEASPGAVEGSPGAESEPLRLPVNLLAVKDRPKGVTFSATQLLTFQADPQNYFRRYHLGFFESDYEFLKQVSDAESMSLVKGKIVHKILEDGIPGSDAEMLARLEQCFFTYEIFDPGDQQTLKTEVPALLQPFAGSEFAQKIFSAGEWKTEITLTMRLVGDSFGEEDYLTGTLDRIFRNPAGEWEVADYKTNNITAAEVEKTGQKYEMQMKTYALLLAQLFPDQPAYPVSLYFLLPEKEYQKVYSPAEVQEIYREFAGLVARIKEYYPFGEGLPGPAIAPTKKKVLIPKAK